MAQKKDAKRRCQIRQRDADDRVGQSDARQDQVILDDQDFRRNQKLHHDQRKQKARPAEFVPHKGVGDQCAQDQVCHQNNGDQDQGVGEIHREGCRAPSLNEIVENPRCIPFEIGGVAFIVKRGPDRIDEGQRPHSGKNSRECAEHNFVQTAVHW